MNPDTLIKDCDIHITDFPVVDSVPFLQQKVILLCLACRNTAGQVVTNCLLRRSRKQESRR